MYPILLPPSLRKKSSNSNISREIYFIDSLNDLFYCLKSNNTYHLLRSSVILRTLLVDGNGWLNDLCDDYHLSLKMTVNIAFLEGKPLKVPHDDKEFYNMFSEFRTNGASYHYINLINSETELLDLESFKEKICLIIRGNKDYCFSVKEIIRMLSNKHGAAHINKGISASDFEAFNFDVFNPFGINDESFFIQKIKEIIAIILEAVKPLMNDVFKHLLNYNYSNIQSKHTAVVEGIFNKNSSEDK